MQILNTSLYYKPLKNTLMYEISCKNVSGKIGLHFIIPVFLKYEAT